MSHFNKEQNQRGKDRTPRVLIISHNPFSDTQSNGKTMTAFFKLWDRENLAQLYLTTDVPDFSLCSRFFQINDIDIFKRFFFNKKIQGRQICNSNLEEIQTKKKAITKSPILKILRLNVSPLMRFLRDLLWKFAGYKTQELINFIDAFDPQVVFFQSSSGVFAFSLTKWICERKKLPLVMQTTDDYVTEKLSFDPFFWIHLLRLKHAFQWACSRSTYIIAIGDKMTREYRRRFGGNYFIAMNTIGNLNLPQYIPSNKTIKFVYAGNLGLNRWKVLVLLSECIEELYYEEGLLGELAVYSLVDPGLRVTSYLNKPHFSSFKGSLNTDELSNVKAGADVLVHVEAFDRKNRHITRLSISTKIPEYLASGRCIFAVGPRDVASMEYLAENDLGIILTSCNKRDIKLTIKVVMLDSDKRMYYAQRGLEVAKTRHNADEVASSMVRIISNTVNA